MLDINTNPMDINPREAGEVFGNIPMDDFDATLRSFFKMKGRAGFCEFLGIRESTLSGWLKEGSLPFYAKVAFGLAVTFENLKKKHQSLIEEYQLPVIVNLGDQWGLMEIRKDNNDTPTGKLLVSGITSQDDAKKIQASIKGAQLFVKAMPQIFSGFTSGSLDYDTYFEEYDENNDDYDKDVANDRDNYVMNLFRSGTELAETLGLNESLLKELKEESMGGSAETPLVNIALKMLNEKLTQKETTAVKSKSKGE